MRKKIECQRGTVLMVAMILVLLMAGLAVAYVAITGSQAMNAYVSYKSDRAFYIAEAGLAQCVADLVAGGSGDFEAQFAGGAYTTTVVVVSTNERSITSEGFFGDQQRVLRVMAYSGVHELFHYAVFAGNSSGDPTYVLKFGGVGSEADEVAGDVYSGEDLSLEGDAVVDGALRAQGDITGGEGERITLPIPDLATMDYPNNHDINVNQQFDENGYWSSLRSSDYGEGEALPESNPAHIFHKNPTDRVTECSMTPGDDFFLEDIYENCPTYNTRVSIAPGGNDQVYFIQGDLWIHNKHTYSFQLKNPDTHITIVVQGSIHIADDFHYHNDVKSGVAFIAIQAPGDPNAEYSGNIYIGDPVFGTVQEINGFFYAENNFIDDNLDQGGSAEFLINGIMSAGNQLAINRDFSGQGHWEGSYPSRYWVPDPGAETYHAKMIVTLDDRVLTGNLVLPGLPEQDPGGEEVTIIGWREVTPGS